MMDILPIIIFNSDWYLFLADLRSLFVQLICLDKTLLSTFFVLLHAGRFGGLNRYFLKKKTRSRLPHPLKIQIQTHLAMETCFYEFSIPEDPLLNSPY